LNLLLIYTGFGLIMGGVTLGVFAMECYWNRRKIALPAVALAIALASLASFFWNYTFQPAVDCFSISASNAVMYPAFVAQMFAGYLELRNPMLFAALAGSAILIVALTGLAAQYRAADALQFNRARILVAAVLLAYSVLFASSTAVGRVCLGLEASQSSRYSTLLIPGFLSVYFSLLALPAARIRKPAMAAFIILLAPGVVWIPKGAHRFSEGKHAWAACYLQTKNAEFCDRATQFPMHPDPQRARLQDKLDYLEARRLSFFSQAE
jgi:hypothetical protein